MNAFFFKYKLSSFFLLLEKVVFMVFPVSHADLLAF